MEKRLAELEKESKNLDERYTALHAQIAVLRNEGGLALLRQGSDSKEFKELAEKIKETEQSLEDLVRLKVVYENAIKQGRREEKRKYMAELLKRNVEIVERFKRDPPPCPKCGSNRSVKLHVIDPSQYNDPGDTRTLDRLDFVCDEHIPGIQFILTPEDWEPLIQKIGTTVKKFGSTVASLL